MLLRVESLPETKLVGKRLTMSLVDNKTFELWRSFMPDRKEVLNRIGTKLFSMQVYNKSLDFSQFNELVVFEKWAAVEVPEIDIIPDEMEAYTMPGGLYAVFIHKGPHATFPKTFQYIFGTWLPDSGYTIDHREHFEIMNEGYNPVDPNGEEEIWIPIKQIQVA